MDDRELLEKAAQAAGHTVFEWGRAPEWHPLRYRDCLLIGPRKSFMEDPDQVPWNPLTDDGDALRLAVKLRLRVETNAETAWAVVLGPSMTPWATEPVGDNPAAATRRAIVRAAAATLEQS